MEQLAGDQDFPIGASPDLADTGTRVLKHDDTFLMCERRGNVLGGPHGQLGLFHRGTRHLSRFRLGIGGQRFLLLGSTVREDNVVLAVELMNPDMLDAEGVSVPHGTLHVRRERLLWDGALYEEITLSSYGEAPLALELSFEIEADFVDLFEVRGTPRAERGVYAPAEVDEHGLALAYTGLDGERRETRISLDRPATSAAQGAAGRWAVRTRIELAPHARELLRLRIACSTSASPAEAPLRFQEAGRAHAAERSALAADDCEITTSNDLVNAWVRRSQSDLRMMISETPHGLYPYAGVPWFSTAFGRDGILTALESLWVNHTLAAGVLEYLAARQATSIDPAVDAEPGKILHEARDGEMAALGEIPFGRYYGSVDATPLFIVLAGRYHRASGDLDRIRRLWPSIEAALGWIDQHGDLDGDGFVEYARRTPSGLIQQGWKDSHDSVFHDDGRDAEGPIALCEVQGYVFAAKHEAAHLARALGHDEHARALETEAAALARRFEERFWCEDLGTYALALDGEKRPCRVRTSNAGHCLFSGIAAPERAARVAATLLAPEMFSGWGVRTVARGEARYNPMSYHNGSVWPHDSALIAQGLSQYGHKALSLAILDGLFDVSCRVELHRLPELFCGFGRRSGEAPTLYPVACAPQAWAAAAVFMLLSSVLGVRVDAARRRVVLDRPLLPEWLELVRLRRLRVGDDYVDLTLHRHPEDVALTVERRSPGVDVIVVK